MKFEIDMSGFEEIEKKLDKLGAKASAVVSEALYEGAAIMADELTKSVSEIKTAPFRGKAKPGETRLPSPEEKYIVEHASKGVAKFTKDSDSVQTSIGYSNSGYAVLNGRTVPVPVIANSINSGTSFMEKQPFIRKAQNASKEKATGKIKEIIEQKMDELINEGE